ncbi:MAG: methyltransferase domain-containing protein [Planctomycetes bacterium]|nr:methyltransferase domain-containing protein [Planctomycetota bacterium]
MNDFIHGVIRAATETFDFPEPILEVGSYQVDGQEHIGNLRGLFPGKRYTGIDIRRGPGVDSVEDVESLPRVNASVGSVIALNVFEHVQCFWRGFEEVQRILRPDGLLIVSCPFHFHIHAYPNDYWRFTPEALRSLLDRMPSKIIGYHGPRKRPLSVWAFAVGPAYPRITEAQHVGFQQLIRQYARQRLRWDKRLRYRIGRLICGARPFAPLLDAESFEMQLIQAA